MSSRAAPTESASTVLVTLRARDGRKTAGVVAIRRRSPRERWTRALAAGAALASIGVAAIALPLVHLVAPPLLWLAALLVFVRRLGEREVVTDGGGPCPACAAPVAVEAGVRPEWPAVALCSSCRRHIGIERAVF